MKASRIVGVVVMLLLAGRASADTIDKAVFEAGKDVKVDDEKALGGFYVVTMPTDYAADKSWPVIVCISPKALEQGAFDPITNRENFVTLTVAEIGIDGGQSVDAAAAEVQRILKALSTKIKIDPKNMIIAGRFSEGGSASEIADATPDRWAGMMLIDPAGAPLIGAHVAGNGMRGKPVLIAVGDQYTRRAESAAIVGHYKTQKADLTELEFKGALDLDPADTKPQEWLMGLGPEKAAKEAYQAAQTLEKAKRPGAAYAAYLAVEKMDESGAWGKLATEQAAAIESKAQDKLAVALALSADGRYAEAHVAFEAVAVEFAGSPFADLAKAREKAQDSDPALQQKAVDAKADALEALAKAAESRGDLAGARGFYERYIASYPTATRMATVKAHLEELKANPASTRPAAATADDMDKDCKGTLMLADGYMKNGNGEKALPLLKEIIKKYPGTQWAKKAAATEAEIEKGM